MVKTRNQSKKYNASRMKEYHVNIKNKQIEAVKSSEALHLYEKIKPLHKSKKV